LQVGATTAMTIVVEPTSAPGSTLVDLAAVTGAQADPVPTNNAGVLDTRVVGESDLAISVVAQAGPIYVGQDVAYTLDVSNQGPDDEPDASVTCPLSSDFVFVSANGTPGSGLSENDGVLTDDLGPLAAGATATVTLVLVPQAAAVGTVATTFVVQGDNIDPVVANNTAVVPVTVAPASDLAIAISTPASDPAVQVDWTYILTASNLGLSGATGVTVLSPLPSNVQLVSVTSSQGSDQLEPGGILEANLGALAAGQAATISVVVMPTADGSMAMSATVNGDQYDPDVANNQATGSATVAKSVKLSVLLTPTPQTEVAGKPLTFTATVDNAGPYPATDLVLSLPMGAGLMFDSSTATAGTSAMVNGQVVAQLGQLNPGSSAVVTLVVTPTTPGTITQTATAAAAENQLDPAGATATTTATILESPGTLQFSTGLVAVAETAGDAVFSVVRSGGALGTVTVNYQSVAVNAIPGLDYVPVAGTLSFASGQTTGTIEVPVLADPWDNHDEYVDVELSSPGGGASLGGLATSQLQIIDVDPNFAPPQVSQLTWAGNSRSITSVNLSFTAPLNPAYADDPANYALTIPTAGNAMVPLSSVSYNPTTDSVTLVPAAPIASGRFYQLQVVGTGATAIRDIAGNILDGAANGLPGSNYVSFFGQGTKLKYIDNSGNKVTLSLTGPGYMEEILNSQSSGQLLTIMGEKPRRTTLSGRVRKAKHGSGSTNLGAINGLGNFGAVRILLKSPPFLLKQYPFQERGKGTI
jgi:uncharacterized repeat protein (TIGR01451 family)